jgi:hypothetical protein
MHIFISGVTTAFEKRTLYFIHAELSKPELTRTSVTSVFPFTYNALQITCNAMRNNKSFVCNGKAAIFTREAKRMCKSNLPHPKHGGD